MTIKKRIKNAVDSLITDDKQKDIIYHYVLALFSEFDDLARKPLAENIAIEVFQAYLSNNLSSLGYSGYDTNKKLIMRWMIEYCTQILQASRVRLKEIKLSYWRKQSNEVYVVFEDKLNPKGKVLYVR